MKKFYLSLIAVVGLLGLASCAELVKPFTVESPRPNKEQISAAQNITEKNVPVIAGMQNDKQRKIALVATAAIHNIAKTKDQKQVEGITNVAANAIDGIQHADGTAKILGNLQARTMDDIMKMPMAEYMMYAAGQSAVASHNIEKAKEGIRAGWQWTSGKLAGAAAAATGGTGLIAFALSMFKKASGRKQLLVKSGKALKEFATENPNSSEALRKKLASAASTVPVDAKKEFGLS